MRSKRDFNFALRWEQMLLVKTGAYSQRKRRQRIITLLVGLFILFAGTAWPWLWALKLRNDLAKVNQSIASMSSIESQVQQLDALKASNSSQIDIINQMTKSNVDPQPILNQMAKLFPTGTTINSFSLAADKTLTMTVSVPTPIDLARLWTNLRDSGLFQNFDVKSFSLLDKTQTLNLSLKLK